MSASRLDIEYRKTTTVCKEATCSLGWDTIVNTPSATEGLLSSLGLEAETRCIISYKKSWLRSPWQLPSLQRMRPLREVLAACTLVGSCGAVVTAATASGFLANAGKLDRGSQSRNMFMEGRQQLRDSQAITCPLCELERNLRGQSTKQLLTHSLNGP